MASEFPRSPKILKGALVAYQLPDLVPTVIVFQYNPEQLTRSLTPRTASGGGRGDAHRTDGPPEETISLAVEIDAADQLERPEQNGDDRRERPASGDRGARGIALSIVPDRRREPGACSVRVARSSSASPRRSRCSSGVRSACCRCR